MGPGQHCDEPYGEEPWVWRIRRGPVGVGQGDDTMIETILEAARAVPASVQLVYRLLRDDRVDERRRAAVVAALAYVMLPFDFIPDRFPIIGRVDDFVISAAALQALFDDAGDAVIREHWDASDRSLESMLGVVEAVAGFMPKPMRRLLGTKGSGADGR